MRDSKLWCKIGNGCYGKKVSNNAWVYSEGFHSWEVKLTNSTGFISYEFDVHRAVHRNIISIVKQTRCTNVSNLFYFGMTFYMFRKVFPSIIRSSRLYIQQQAYVKQILLSSLSTQTAVSVWQMSVAVCTVLNSWWWTERPSETCRGSFQNKINLIHLCILLYLL